MPYSAINELPGNVQGVLPKPAQYIYQKAFNSAWETYDSSEKRRGNDSRETVAHKIAWTAVEQKYHKNSKTGHWEEK